MNRDDDAQTVASDNLYADFGFPDAEERLAKTKLAIQINAIIEQRRLTQVAAARVLGIEQARVSNLRTGRLRGFSVEKLFELLNRLDQDVTITVEPKHGDRAQTSVYTSVEPMAAAARSKPETMKFD